MKYGIVIISFLFFSFSSTASDSTLIQKYLQTILNKQVVNDSFFIKGTFPSFRQYANNKNLKEDNTIFFAALIHFTLNEIKFLLTQDEKQVADTICNRIANAYPYFKTPKPRGTYNFWPYKNGVKTFFPNQGLLTKLTKALAIPDDIDDSGIIFTNLNVSENKAQKLHDSTQQYINGKHKWAKNTFKQFKKMPAYNTWYGVKMPVEFDFGVHCNYLYFANYYKVKPSLADTATLQLLTQQLQKNYHISKPNFISPYYYNSSNLIYHATRLGSKFSVFDKDLTAKLILQSQQMLQVETSSMNKILLATSLLKLKQKPTNFNDNFLNTQNLNTTEFVFYKGHLLGHLGNTIKKIASNTKYTQFHWFCSAFNDCLVLEYLVLKRHAHAN